MQHFKDTLERLAPEYADAGALAEQEAWANQSAPFKFSREDAATLQAARAAREISRTLYVVLSCPDAWPILQAAFVTEELGG